jgi:hypothetical protein
MRRRTFLHGAAAGGLAALAGCSVLGGSTSPPRRSDAVDTIRMQDGALQIDLADQPYVESRQDADAPVVQRRLDLSALSPVGRAAAKGKGGGGGKGATGRGSGGYSSAPRTHRGRAKYHGGAYGDDWREDHEDEVRRYRAAITAVGVAYLGSQLEFQDDKPGAGPVPWDDRVRTPDDTLSYDVGRPGWYRVGSHMEARGGNTDFGWEAVDVQVQDEGSSMAIEEKWKVSPRL